MTCFRCNDLGLIEYTGGTHKSEHWMRGQLVVLELEATPEKPVFKRCSCRDAKPVPPEPARTAKVFE